LKPNRYKFGILNYLDPTHISTDNEIIYLYFRDAFLLRTYNLGGHQLTQQDLYRFRSIKHFDTDKNFIYILDQNYFYIFNRDLQTQSSWALPENGYLRFKVDNDVIYFIVNDHYEILVSTKNGVMKPKINLGKKN